MRKRTTKRVVVNSYHVAFAENAEIAWRFFCVFISKSCHACPLHDPTFLLKRERSTHCILMRIIKIAH